MKLCRLITLDVMGTILDVSAPVGVSYSHIGTKFGVHVNPQLLTKNFNIAWREMKFKHPNYGRHSGLGWENWWKQLVHQTFINSSNSTLDIITLNNISDHLLEIYSFQDQWRCCDGALNYIEHIYSKRIHMAVLSNFDDRLEDLLETMGLRKYFSFVVGSYAAGYEKPDLRIFSLVESTARRIKDLHDVEKSEILHIGDTPDLDYIPAKIAGWNACLINKDIEATTKKFPTIDRQFIFKDLHELKKSFP